MVSGAATAAASDLDKTILLRSTSSVITGQYAAAYRVMQAATLPINSLILAATPRLFRASGTGSLDNIGQTLMLATVAYAISASIVVWTLAPILPWLLGDEFINSIGLLRLLCLLLIATCIRQMAVAQLTALDMQSIRNWIECTSVVVTLLAMLIVIPTYGAAGAITIAVVTDISAATLSWILATKHHRFS
jgi:O-antigen/teichoic acid export membrane protein